MAIEIVFLGTRLMVYMAYNEEDPRKIEWIHPDNIKPLRPICKMLSMMLLQKMSLTKAGIMVRQYDPHNNKWIRGLYEERHR